MSTAKKEKKKRKAAAQNVAEIESPQLQAEVAAFASQLGLGGATGAGGADHAFDDFAPQQAKQQPGAASKRKASAAAAADGDVEGPGAEPAAAPAAKKRRGKPPGAVAGAGQQAEQPFVGPVSDAMAAAIREREWNAGVGPRPGDGKRSLIGKDSPALWYEALAALPPLPPGPANTPPPSEAKVAELRQRGQALLEREAAVFEAELGRKNGQDARWLQQVRRSGTTSDKVAAITLLLQESAVANLKSLDQLVSWVARHKGGRSVVGQAMDAGREVFLTALLPDRKLRWLGQQPLAALPTGRDGERRLLLWTLEDAIKQRYGAFVAALEEGSRDNLEYVKERAVAAAAELLRQKPEAEAQLLSLLVNKLGDPSRKLASKAGYLLGNVLAEHPGMKAIVVAEVQRFLFRPGLQERARYYAVVFLNQLQLSHHPTHGGSELAKKLIDVYLTLFSLIMTGKVGHAATLQRAAEEKAEAEATARKKGGKHKGSRQKGGRHKQHKHPPKKGAPGVAVSSHTAEEMDARMLGALVAGVRRAFPFVDAAEVEAVIDKHSDALFRITHTAPLGVSLQVLALMLQLMGSRRAVSDRFYRALYAVVLSPEVSRANKAPMFVSLVFKAMKVDVSIKRVAAFAKRLLQVALHSPAPFAAGILFLLSEVLKVKSSLWTAILQPQEAADEVEHFRDAADPNTAAAVQDTAQQQWQQQRQSPAVRADSPAAEESADEPGDDAMGAAERPAAQPAGRANDSGAAAAGPQSSGEPPWPAPGGYDMHKREPLYCGAETACWWEMAALTRHCHPSVVAMASSLAAGASVVYDGDPLRDLALPAFLDKFVRRKAKIKARGGSVMQPLAKAAGDAAAAAAEPGTSAFAALAAADVKPDAVFFHKFYSAKEARAPSRKRAVAEGDEDASDASDAEIDRVLDEEEDAGAEGIDEGGIAGDYDYSTLADAFDESGSEGGSDADASDEEGGSGTNSEDINPLELAEPTTSEEGDGGDGLSMDDSSDDAGSGGGGDDSSSDEDMGDFASADLWAERIDAVERGEGAADDGADSRSDDDQPARPRRKKRKGVATPAASGRQTKKRRQGRRT